MNISDFKNSLQNKNIYVVGLSGQEGYAVGEFLQSLRIPFTACDLSQNREEFVDNFKFSHEYLTPKEQEKKLAEIFTWPITLHLRDNYLKDAEKADVIYVPQSYHRYEANQKLLELKKTGKKLIRLIQLFFELSPCPIIGITGTVGKSTTTALTAKILKDAYYKVYQTGNDRENIWDFQKLLSMPHNGFLVLEISNRQLMDFPYSPHVAVITNISPHHADEHPSLKDYIETKKNILRYQKPKDFAVIPRGETFSLTQAGKGQKLFFDENLEGLADLKPKLLGVHNLKNIAAAVVATGAVEVNRETALKMAADFPSLSHRLEFVKELSGVRFYNDSKSTDPVSTIAALQSFKESKILILGGRRKGAIEKDFEELAREIYKNNVKQVFLIGESKEIIKNALKIAEQKCAKKCGRPKLCNFLEEAVSESYKVALPGDIVLLSPACESFGLFRDFRERGEKFKQIVSSLKPKE